MGAKRRFNGTSKVNTHTDTHTHTQTYGHFDFSGKAGSAQSAKYMSTSFKKLKDANRIAPDVFFYGPFISPRLYDGLNKLGLKLFSILLCKKKCARCA